MTRIRLAVAAAMLVFGAAPFAPAQQPTQQTQTARQAKGGHGRRSPDAALLRGVKLSATERANLKAVRQKYAAQTKALRSSSTPDRTQLAALRQSERNDMRGALSAANQAKFDANATKFKRRSAKPGTPVTP